MFALKCEQFLLVGQKKPYFWNVLKKSSEYNDNKENPLDGWSKKNHRKI